jgi:hypothetical protein
MKISYEGTVLRGRALDVRGLDVSARDVVAAIREEASPVAIDAPTPGEIHERVGRVRPGMGLQTRTALAVAARSLGYSAPQDEEIAAVEAKLSAVSRPSVSTRAARKAASDRGSETERVRERVAELRGRVQAARERGEEPTELEAELATAVRELSEVETAAAAARETLVAAREDAREARDARERRMRLEDRRANLERAARAQLVERVDGAYADAVRAVPGPTPADPFDADPVTAALAIGRVADLAAPVVLECDRFESEGAAASWLDAPVVRL